MKPGIYFHPETLDMLEAIRFGKTIIIDIPSYQIYEPFYILEPHGVLKNWAYLGEV